MTITVSTTQRSSIALGPDATVLDLIQALTENLGGEWDEAKLEKPLGALVDDEGRWSFGVVLSDGHEEEAHPERWTTEDGEHVAVWNVTQQRRQCNCGVYGSDDEIAAHLRLMADG